MGEVINIRSEEESELIWVCQCGCSTFELLSSQELRCANCELMSTFETAAWDNYWDKGEMRADDAAPRFSDVQGCGSVDFARARLNRIASQSDVALLVVATEDGSVSVWSSDRGEDHLAWAEERIDIAHALLGNRIGCSRD
jgi:hypothetical protein